MDIMITYETLFDLLRKERSLEDLQELDPAFWLHVVTYLKEREAFLATTSRVEQEKTRIQLYNIKRIIREIYERRERKIIQLAMNVIRSDNTNFVDKRNMLAEEKLMFDETLKMLGKYKRDVLEHVCNNELPTLVSYDEALKEKEEEPINEPSTSSPKTTEQSLPPQSEQQTKESLVEEDADTIMVKFTTSVPKFMGKQKEVFGPYEPGAIANLPGNIANILLKKEKAQRVMAQ